jgi:hypothetical protein
MGLAWLLPSSSPTFSIFTRKCCLRKFHFMAKATSLAWQTDPQNDFPRLWGNINFNLPVFQFNVAINKIPLFNRCFQCKAIFLLEVVIKFYLWPIAKIKHLQSCYFHCFIKRCIKFINSEKTSKIWRNLKLFFGRY